MYLHLREKQTWDKGGGGVMAGGTSEESHHLRSSLKQHMPSGRSRNIFSDMHCSPEQAKGLALGFVSQMILVWVDLG